MKTTLKNYFGIVLLITSMIFILKSIQIVWIFLDHVL
jgi:hypothetical protein